MSDQKTRLVLDDLSGGRNNRNSPLGPVFQTNQVIDAVNVDWYRTTGARKRWFSSVLSMTGAAFTQFVSFLGRHVPGVTERDAELWACDEVTFYRLDNSTTWTQPGTIVDVPSGSPIFWHMTAASLNGLYFLSYPSGQNRLHCYDASTDSIRRTGVLVGTTPPTVANTGTGSYPATVRYYRIRWVVISGVHLLRRSEPTPTVAFTPSGTGTAARITRPTTPSDEGITSWELELSSDNATFYQYAGFERGNTIPIATTTFDHTGFVADDIALLAAAGLVSELTGTYGLQKSYRLIAADQNRLIGWGSWNSGDKQNRLEISAIVGSLDRGDAERVDMTTNYFIDFDELDSGPPVALVGPVWDRFYAFKTRQLYELIPTGSIEQPYRRVKLSGDLGCVSSAGACRGEDAAGNPCLYFLAHRGVYRYGLSGFEYIGQGIEDLILGPTSVINMVTAVNVAGFVLYYPDLNQLWVWFATGTLSTPETLCVFDVAANGGRGGWTRYEGQMMGARCAVMFADTIGSTMGFQLVPYIGSTQAINRILKAVDKTATADPGGVGVQATITTRPLSVSGFRVATGDVQLLAPAASGVTLNCTVTPDFGASPTVTGTASLTPVGAETRVSTPFSGSALGGSEFTQLVIGDAAPNTNRWSFDRVIVPIHNQEPVSG